jgi:hypothetical protein
LTQGNSRAQLLAIRIDVVKALYAAVMTKLKDLVDGLIERRHRNGHPNPKQLDRWANEGGALPPELREDPESR